MDAAEIQSNFDEIFASARAGNELRGRADCPACMGEGLIFERSRPPALCKCQFEICECEKAPPYLIPGTSSTLCPAYPAHVWREKLIALTRSSGLPERFFWLYLESFQWAIMPASFESEARDEVNASSFAILSQIVRLVSRFEPPKKPRQPASPADEPFDVLGLSEEARAPNGLFLYGPSHFSGKTHLSAIIINEIQRRTGTVALFKKSGEIFDSLMASLSDRSRSVKTIADKLKSPPLLILDALGAEREQEMFAAVIGNVLEHRFDRGLLTVINSTQTLDSLDQHYKDQGHIVSRIRGLMVPFQVHAGNYVEAGQLTPPRRAGARQAKAKHGV